MLCSTFPLDALKPLTLTRPGTKPPTQVITIIPPLPDDDEQHYLVPLGSLLLFFVILPGIYLWKQEPTYITAAEKRSNYLM